MDAGMGIPFYKLGLTVEEAERLADELIVMRRLSADNIDLCRQVVDKYGVEAVYVSVCLYLGVKMRPEGDE